MVKNRRSSLSLVHNAILNMHNLYLQYLQIKSAQCVSEKRFTTQNKSLTAYN